jgi:hypothetical protein
LLKTFLLFLFESENHILGRHSSSNWTRHNKQLQRILIFFWFLIKRCK